MDKQKKVPKRGPQGLLGRTKRVTGNVTPEFDAELDKWAAEFGLTKTGFVTMCIRAGAKSLTEGQYLEGAPIGKLS